MLKDAAALFHRLALGMLLFYTSQIKLIALLIHQLKPCHCLIDTGTFHILINFSCLSSTINAKVDEHGDINEFRYPEVRKYYLTPNLKLQIHTCIYIYLAMK